MKKPQIAFIVQRMNWYRIYAPVIQAAIDAGWDVELWHDFSIGKSCNPLEVPRADLVQTFLKGQMKFVSYSNSDELLRLLETTTCQAVCSLTLPYLFFEKVDKRKTPKFIFLEASPCDATTALRKEWQLEFTDLFLFSTQYWLDRAVFYFQDVNKQISKEFIAQQINLKSQIIGWPQTEYQKLDRQQVRFELGIPPEKRVFLYSNFSSEAWAPFGGHLAVFSQRNLIKKMRTLFQHKPTQMLDFSLYQRISLEQTIQNIKSFAEKNNALLVIKVRSREVLAPIERKFADRVYFDDSYYPSTLFKVLSISDLALSYHSMIARECAAAHVPHLTLDVCDISQVSTMHESQPFYGYESKNGRFFNTPGMSWLLNEDDVRSLQNKELSYYRLESAIYEKFNQKYLGKIPSSRQDFLFAVETIL